MKNLFLILPFIIMLFMMNSCQNEALLKAGIDPIDANANVQLEKKASTPFKATFLSTFTGNVPDGAHCNAGELNLNQAGPGRASHMGSSDLTISSCLTFIYDSNGNILRPDQVLDGRFVITAANGDILELRVAETIATSPNDGGGDYVVYTPGCTGRFSNATGCGVASYVINRDANGLPVSNNISITGSLCKHGNCGTACN